MAVDSAEQFTDWIGHLRAPKLIALFSFVLLATVAEAALHTIHVDRASMLAPIIGGAAVLILTNLLYRTLESGIELIPADIRATFERRVCRALDHVFPSTRERYLQTRVRELRLRRSRSFSKRVAQRAGGARVHRRARPQRSRACAASSRKPDSNSADPDPVSNISLHADSVDFDARGAS